MEVLFFDSSGLAKRYINERGSTWVNEAAESSAYAATYVAHITGVEVV